MQKEDCNEELADSLGRLAWVLHAEAAWEPEGMFLYAEFEPGVVAAGVYKELGDHVICHEPQDALFDALFDLWNQADPDKKWCSLTYSIKDGKFEASFEYPDQWDESENYHNRSGRILLQKYGTKPIEYAPLPGMDG